MSDYEFATLILRRPRVVFARAKTLRDVLALLHGVAVGRYPPHGSGFLPGFDEFVSRRLGAFHVAAYGTLLDEFGSKPLADGCEAVLALLEEWKAETDEMAARSDRMQQPPPE